MASLLAALPDDDDAPFGAGYGDTASDFMFRGEPDTACNPLSLPFPDPSSLERSATESVRSVPIIDSMTPHAAQLATRHF
jgi:hypothetical protein